MMPCKWLALTGPAILVAAFGGTVQAAGFYIKEQSVTGLGRAFAGEAAVAEDASTIYFNPAGMTELPGAEAQAGIHLILPHAKLKDRGSTVSVVPLGLTRSTGGAGSDNPYDPTPVPNGFVAVPLLNRDLWLGLGVTAPFGIATEYPANWFGRYDSIKSALQTIDIAPSVAWRVNDWISIGGGIDIQKADAEITNAVFTGPTSPDIIARVEGDDWAVGYNVGVLFKPIPPTRIGIHYRSQVDHDLEGEFTTLASNPATAALDLPKILSFGVAHQITPKLTLLGGAEWFGWKSFNEIRVVTASSPEPVRQNYRNTYAVTAGAQYAWSDNLTVRGGFQFDQTPTVDGFRTSRTPDGDRYWLSAGLSYRVGQSFTVDVGYSHIFVENEEIDVVRATNAALSTRTRAETEGGIDIVSAALRYRF
jgi:long-chain fatty acid transport protein